MAYDLFTKPTGIPGQTVRPAWYAEFLSGNNTGNFDELKNNLMPYTTQGGGASYADLSKLLGINPSAPQLPMIRQGTGNLLSTARNQDILFGDIYKPQADNADKYFQDYLSKIAAPSSVDEVQRGIESDVLRQTLEDIDRQTGQDLASAKLEYGDKGLLGTGRTSDIVENALAQIRTGGARTKAGARSNLALAEIQRQKAREEAMRGAYGTRYGVGADISKQERDIASRGALTDAQIMSELLGTEYKGGITTGEGSAERQLKGGLGLAELKSREEQNQMNQMLDYLMNTGKLSQQDRQFYQELSSRERESALDRDLRMYLGELDASSRNQSYTGDPMFDLLIGSVGGGIGGGIGAGIGTGISRSFLR